MHLPSTSAHRRSEITALNGMGPKTQASLRAKAKNNDFIAQRRCNARALLRSAHARGVLPFTEVDATHFNYRGEGSSTNAAILAFDDDDD